MTTFTYFAYGSNMLLEWLKKRCPSAFFVSSACVCGYELAFDKKSKDGSGKATILRTNDGVSLYGALFKIDASELKCLNNAEGPGYEWKDAFTVKRLDKNVELSVATYIAKEEARGTSLNPYDWYKQLIIAGAQQAGLPEDYIRGLERVPAIPDKCESRKARIEARAVLGKMNE